MKISVHNEVCIILFGSDRDSIKIGHLVTFVTQPVLDSSIKRYSMTLYTLN